MQAILKDKGHNFHSTWEALFHNGMTIHWMDADLKTIKFKLQTIWTTPQNQKQFNNGGIVMTADT